MLPGARHGKVEIGHPFLSVRRQCELLGLNRSSYYYQPATESDLNLKLIDEQYLKMPFYGYRKIYGDWSMRLISSGCVA